MVMRNRRFGSPDRGYSRASAHVDTRRILEEEVDGGGRALRDDRSVRTLLQREPAPRNGVEPADPRANRLIAVEGARRSIRAGLRELAHETQPRRHATEVYESAPPGRLRRLWQRLRSWLG
jgi:hypothetical protein